VFDPEDLSYTTINLDAAASFTVNADNFNETETRFILANRSTRIRFSNEGGDILALELDAENKVFSLDRRQSGITDFQEDFGKEMHQMPVPDLPDDFEIRILMDWSSVEIFINGGQYVMTDQLFPKEFYTQMTLENSSDIDLNMELGGPFKIERVW
jgi:fructan beta-fructosidase